MRRFWSLFFIFWPIVAIAACWIAPDMGWWFPGEGGKAQSPLGERIDGLFYLILVIVAVTFVGTQAALGYAVWRGAHAEEGGKAWHTHGSHNLEVIWTIVPAGVLLFISLYQLDVWAAYRVQAKFDPAAVRQPIAEVTARQFEWRIRYPAPDRVFQGKADVENWLRHPEPGDLYTVNDLHVPSGRAVLIHLRTADVQHAFFVPLLRVKQDAVPGLVIPVWFEASSSQQYELLCAELCGWGHYKMKARLWAQSEEDYRAYLEQLKKEQFDDGVVEKAAVAESK
ncbi:MAG: cytochrome c oxidase subunit II [Planctomycetaceae bacterium]